MQYYEELCAHVQPMILGLVVIFEHVLSAPARRKSALRIGGFILPDDHSDHHAEMILPATIGRNVRRMIDVSHTSREALAKALGEESEINQARATLQAQINAAQTATVSREAAEAAWAAFVIEDGLSAKPDNAKRAELRAAVLAAREAIKPLADDQAKLAELQTAALAINRRIEQLQRDIILAEAGNLAEAYHHHEARALKARAAIEALARSAISMAESHRDNRSANELKPGEQRDHSAAQPFIDLALQLRRSLDYGPDPQASAAGRAARIAAAETYGRSVAAWVAALNADPHARLPSLED